MKIGNFVGRFLLIFTLISYALFLSPIAYYLGTHNLRFFSPISYVFFAVLTVLGLKKIADQFKRQKKLVFIFPLLLLTLYSSLLIYDQVRLRAAGFDSRVPVTDVTYVPNSLIAGLKLLNQYQDKTNVLAGPYSNIGMLVPIFTDRRVFVGHPNATPDLENKQKIAYLFYTGQMDEKTVQSFLKTNCIGFVLVVYLDNFDFTIIDRYRFLKPIFNNQLIKIWQVKI